MADVPAIINEEPVDAYSLLSMPTLDISDAQAELIIADLRKRREAYVKDGKVDKPKVEKLKVEKAKLTKDDKARNTAALLAQLKIPGMENK